MPPSAQIQTTSAKLAGRYLGCPVIHSVFDRVIQHVPCPSFTFSTHLFSGIVFFWEDGLKTKNGVRKVLVLIYKRR